MKKSVYIDIAEQIMIETLNSDLTPGSKIDSVRSTAMRFGVNPKTIQKAFEYLDSIGIFSTVVGGGRYLSKDADVLNNIRQQLILSEIEEFTQKMIMLDCELDFVNSEISIAYQNKEQNGKC